jgi:hypothetical protein
VIIGTVYPRCDCFLLRNREQQKVSHRTSHSAFRRSLSPNSCATTAACSRVGGPGEREVCSETASSPSAALPVRKTGSAAAIHRDGPNQTARASRAVLRLHLSLQQDVRRVQGLVSRGVSGDLRSNGHGVLTDPSDTQQEAFGRVRQSPWTTLLRKVKAAVAPAPHLPASAHPGTVVAAPNL